jgi:chromosome segregation protein
MTADAAILMDRFVSASSATDAHDSLQALLDGLKSRNEETRIDASLIYQDSTVLDAFLTVLATSSYKDVPLEEGPSLVCRIYQELWKSDGAASVLLKDPAPGRLVESLLDVVSDTNQMDYARVLGLQILNSVCTKAPSTAQSQLLSTPNGLHRLADLFSENNDAVRNELLGGVSQSIAKWPSCAKIWVFGEVCDVLMTIVIKEGGLTGGHVLVKDCLELVESLVDPTLADLIWQSPIVAPKLASLLDLRGGTEFINPPKPTVSQSDDLDDILATGNKKKVEQVLPKLTYNEEDVVIKVLHILGTLLDNAESRPGIWKQHGPLCSLVWELALVSKPPSGTKPVCALPSAKLQQLALETTSKYFHDAATMKQHFGVDRLLYIVCTGGGSTSKWEAKLGMSQAALHVLRQTLPEDEAREILTHTLAPPMHSDDDDKPPVPTVVQKLLNTVFENMQDSETTLERRRINLLGALGALSVFIRSPTDKEIMLGISSNLVDTLLQSLEQQEDHTVRMALLRFACEWVVDAPTVVQAFLASSHSVVLSVLLGSEQKEVATMVGFLLGLFMEYILGNDEQHGGWTKKSIMELVSKRKGGISGYTTDLEQLKKADLPWTACELEWHLFIKWYSAQVLAIRRCVVHELTAGGETDEDDDGVAGNGTSNASTKSLNRLVSQQAAELEELRMSLSEAKATIESQDGQLAVWKRRVESNPTQLDKMLSEYTDKNAEMENEVSTLHKQMQEKELEFNARLKERDDQIAQLQATVQEWQTRELESRQERDDLRGELEGLTSAYATLEQEYNRRDGAATQGAAPSAPTGEHPAQQHEGEGSQQDESTGAELATLRAENARLRSDAQAADDWMAMAVQRMNDIGGQNQTLQQEVATLQGQLQQAQLTGGFVAPVVNGITQEQFDEERQNREQVERQLVEAKAVSSKLEVEISALRQQLEESTAQDTVDSSIVEELKRRLAEEEIRRQELEAKLKSAQTDTTTAMDSLGDSKSERERLEREVAALQDELQVARSEMDALCEWRDERDRIIDSKDDELENMQSLLSSKDVELLGLRQQLSELRDSVGAEVNVDMNSQELVSLRESVQSLSASLEKTRQELDETASREREEIQRRDERIRELELSSNQVQSRDQPPWDAAGFSGGSEGIDIRDEEIKSLREANEAAQEWMAKAVEHHQMLSDQVSALTEDKAALTKEINDLQQSSSAPSQSLSDASNETIGQLKRELSDRTTELTNLGAKIIKLESEVRIKETEMAGVQEIVARCDQLQMEVDSLQLARDAKVEKALELEKELAKVVSENEELSAQIDVLRQDLDEKERLVASCADTQSEEMELLRGLLRERESVIVGLREELEDAKDSLADADKVRRLLQESKKESSRFQADLLEAQSSLASVNDKTASFEQLQAELESLREAYSVLEKDHNLLNSNNTDIDRLRDEIAWTKSELKTITEERDSLNDNVSQLETQLSEFQTWANAAQEKIAELQNERDIADQASKTSLGAELSKDADTGIIEGLRDEVASVKRKLTDAITERDALKETVSGLESRLSEFQAWADLAQLKITELQTQNEALELSTAKPAESAVTANNKETDSLRKEMASTKNEIASLTTERDDLKKALSEMETQLSELQSWSDAAQSKIAQLETEKDALEAKAKDLADSAKDINKAIVDSLREEIASTKSELESVTTERDFIKENVREMETKLSEFQSWSDTAQLKISELQQEKDDSEKEIEKLVESQKETMEKLESIREEMVMKSIELSNALEEKNELQEANANLDSKLEKTKLENNNLYAKNSSLEQDVKVLETQCNDLREKSNATDALLKEKDEALLVAETSITELETALESLQEQSAGVVDEWKGKSN